MERKAPEEDPVMEGWLNLARENLEGDTPEERLQNLMAELSYLPQDIQDILRPALAVDLGVESPQTGVGGEGER